MESSRNIKNLKSLCRTLLAFLAIAFGLHILNNQIISVSAQVDRIAFIESNINFGTVFLKEIFEEKFYVKPVEGYINQIFYSLIKETQPKEGNTEEYCLENPQDYAKCFPSICANLDITSNESENDTTDSASLNDPAGDRNDEWKVRLDTSLVNEGAAENSEANPGYYTGDYGCNIKLVLKDENGTGSSIGNPIVKAKWEMNIGRDSGGKYLGTDDSSEPGAQFLPSGKYQVSKNIASCAIATDSDGLSDINAVYADIFYPTDVSLGPDHEENQQGCGEIKAGIKLDKLSKSDGYELFCGKIKSANNNLAVFDKNYNYDEICAIDGELAKETAAVYCAENPLSYEDPSGNYRARVMAQDKDGLNGFLENSFRYLDLTAFEADFDSVNYGKVKLNTHKIIGGDLKWGTANRPTVRNVGNTRLKITVLENDMDLGKTGSEWNVSFKSRVGAGADFTKYFPETMAILANPLNLSAIKDMDFSIEVSRFRRGNDKLDYTGMMTLGAIKEDHLKCE